jgi:hypothetical protein
MKVSRSSFLRQVFVLTADDVRALSEALGALGQVQYTLECSDKLSREFSSPPGCTNSARWRRTTKAFGKPKFKKPETKFLHPGELQNFRACAATRALGEGVACELLLETMLRISEVINADVSDLAQTGPAGTR